MRDHKIIAALIIVGAAAAIAGAAVAQDAPAPARSEPAGEIDGTIFHAQVLLDRAGFAPGVIDGKKGMSFEEAVEGFQTSRGLEVTGQLDTPTRRALLADKPVLCVPALNGANQYLIDTRSPLFSLIHIYRRDAQTLERSLEQMREHLQGTTPWLVLR